MAEHWYLPILSSVLSGLVGAAVVYYFGIRQLMAQRRINFLERQLSEFYAPLAGMRQQIQAKGELRLKVSAAANAAWLEICQSYGDSIMHDREERFAPFNKIILYENKQLESELVPVYRQMLALFTERYHLAGPDTRSFYQEFFAFVEIWNRWLADSLPGEVVQKLDHDAEKVKPFYEHLEIKMQLLQDEIAHG